MASASQKVPLEMWQLIFNFILENMEFERGMRPDLVDSPLWNLKHALNVCYTFREIINKWCLKQEASGDLDSRLQTLVYDPQKDLRYFLVTGKLAAAERLYWHSEMGVELRQFLKADRNQSSGHRSLLMYGPSVCDKTTCVALSVRLFQGLVLDISSLFFESSTEAEW